MHKRNERLRNMYNEIITYYAHRIIMADDGAKIERCFWVMASFHFTSVVAHVFGSYGSCDWNNLSFWRFFPCFILISVSNLRPIPVISLCGLVGFSLVLYVFQLFLSLGAKNHHLSFSNPKPATLRFKGKMSNFDRKYYKTGETSQKDKWFHFHACITPPPPPKVAQK